MGKGLVVSKKEYERVVSEAKQVLFKEKNKQMIIAQMCLRLCDVTHGGRKGPFTLTAKKFAIDIGINPRTLFEWLRLYRRIYLQLEPHLRTLAKFDNLMRASRRIKAPYRKQEVNKIFEDEIKSPSEVIKFRKYIQHLNAILYNSQRPQNLRWCDNDMIFKMIMASDAISKNLREYLNSESTDRKLKIRKHQSNIHKKLMKKYQAPEIDF